MHTGLRIPSVSLNQQRIQPKCNGYTHLSEGATSWNMLLLACCLDGFLSAEVSLPGQSQKARHDRHVLQLKFQGLLRHEGQH